MSNGWRGLALPIRFENGQFAMSEAIPADDIFDKIDESIEFIVTSNEYENPMTGIGVPGTLLFKQFNSALVSYYQNVLKERINEFEQRVVCTDVYVSKDNNDDGVRLIEVYYSVKSSDIPRLLPIYV